jgi:protease I
MTDISDKKVAIIVADYVEEAEFTEPKKALEDAGVEVTVISTKGDEIHGMHHAELTDTFEADMQIDEANAEDYDMIVMPGGAINADELRMSDRAKNWIRNFLAKGKPIAAICHAPWVLASADVVDGVRLTSYPTLRDDLQNAGATWIDKELVIDNDIITSRNPDDIPAFNNAILARLAAA